MKKENLIKALRFFDGESGLDNTQVQYFLKEAFSKGEIKGIDIYIELRAALKNEDLDWKELVQDMNLLNNIESYSNSEIKEYVIELVQDLILPVTNEGIDKFTDLEIVMSGFVADLTSSSGDDRLNTTKEYIEIQRSLKEELKEAFVNPQFNWIDLVIKNHISIPNKPEHITNQKAKNHLKSLFWSYLFAKEKKNYSEEE